MFDNSDIPEEVCILDTDPFEDSLTHDNWFSLGGNKDYFESQIDEMVFFVLLAEDSFIITFSSIGIVLGVCDFGLPCHNRRLKLGSFEYMR